MISLALDALPPEGRRLLDAVLAAPGDDVPRVLFADWLDTQGDPRGEFIRVQCALHAGLNPAERIVLREREKALLSAHRRAWLAPYDVRGLSLEFQRGFVGEAAVWDLSRAGDALARLFASEPVRALALRAFREGDAAVRRVVEAGWVARLDKLTIAGACESATRDALARALAGSMVTRLSPGAGGPGLVAALVREGVVARLASLVLPVGTDDDALADLAGAPPGLQSLYAPGASVGARGVYALASSPLMEGLSTLCLNRNEAVDDAAAQALAGSPRASALQWLELADTALGPAGARALAGSPHLLSLKRLDVRGTAAARGDGLRALEARWPGKVRAR